MNVWLSNKINHQGTKDTKQFSSKTWRSVLFLKFLLGDLGVLVVSKDSFKRCGLGVLPVFAILSTLLLTGCGTSPPTTFITLEPQGAKAAASLAGPPVSVGKVTLPAELDRPALVRRLGGNRLDVAGLIRWAAPLDVMVRRTLARDLANRLPSSKVVMPGQPTPEGPSRVFVVAFQTFWAGPDNQVTLRARWTLTTVNPAQDSDASSAQPQRQMSRDFHVTTQAASSSADDTAKAMSEALARLADQMAAALMDPGASD